MHLALEPCSALWSLTRSYSGKVARSSDNQPWPRPSALSEPDGLEMMLALTRMSLRKFKRIQQRARSVAKPLSDMNKTCVDGATRAGWHTL